MIPLDTWEAIKDVKILKIKVKKWEMLCTDGNERIGEKKWVERPKKEREYVGMGLYTWNVVRHAYIDRLIM